MKEEMKNVTKNELQCEIVQDLLPLYHDDVVNTVTKQAVKQHLDGCENCTKEYQELCEEFPQDNKDEETTKSRFDNMKKRIKKKQVVKTALIAIISCVVVVLLGYVLIYEPIIPVADDAFAIQAAYKVQKEDKTLLFVVYTGPDYTGPMSWHIESEQNGTETVIRTNLKRTVITSQDDFFGATTYDYVEIGSSTDKVTFAGEVIWSEEENGNEKVPEYVDMILDFDSSDVEYGVVIADDGIRIDFEKEGKYISWDFAGNVMREGYYEDAPSKYFEGTVVKVEEDYMLIQPFWKYWIANLSNVISVSVNTEEGQSAKDFKDVEAGDTVGVRFYGNLPKEPTYQIDTVSNIVLDVESDK